MVDSDIKAHINKHAPGIYICGPRQIGKKFRTKLQPSDLNSLMILGTTRSTPIMSNSRILLMISLIKMFVHTRAMRSLKNDTNKALRRAHWQYVNNILLGGLQSKECKPFWRYVKSTCQDTIGVAPLKSKGNLFSDSKSKATILNYQIKSVFTPTQDPDSDIPLLEGPNYPSIAPLIISSKGVEKLGSKLNAKKASGPDIISCRILRELSTELALILVGIFTQSI